MSSQVRGLVPIMALVVLLAGCGGPDDGDGANGEPRGQDEADVRQTVTRHGRNVAWALGRTSPISEDDVAAGQCAGSAPAGSYQVRGRFDVEVAPDQYDGGLDRLRQQWEQLGWQTDTSGTGNAIVRIVGRAPGADSYQIAVARTGPRARFRIEVTSPCYDRPGR